MPRQTSNTIRALDLAVKAAYKQWNDLKKQHCKEDAALDPLVKQYKTAKQQLAAALQQQQLEEEAQLRAEVSYVVGPDIARNTRFVNGQAICGGVNLYGSNCPPANWEECDFCDDEFDTKPV